MESTERDIRINKVLRELNISLDSAVKYFNDNGIIIDSNPNYKLSDKEYKMLQNHFIVNNVGIIRINKVLRELNISLERAVDYLKDKGINIESNPNTKISNEVYNILCGQFAGDKGNKYASKELSEEKRKEKEALRLERENEIENNQVKDKKHHELVSNIIEKTNAKFYLVDSNLDNKNKSSKPFNEGFWQVINSNNVYVAITKKISIGDILISKSILTNNDEAYLIVTEIGIVIEPLNRRNKFDVAWIIKNQNLDIKISEISNYRSIIVEPSKSVLKKIFAKIESKDVKILDDALSGLKSELQSNQLKPNITTIPGLLCDSEIGEDHLDIKKDVEAFARVMAAKSFTPPLAIALLGKWGSGKSFFMHKLKEDIQKLSSNNPQNAFCEGIAHVHFNAWSYMDANLWASIVTRIFETLDDYIKNTFASEKEIKKIENQLFNKLNVSKEQLNNLNIQKESIDDNIQKLQKEKDKLKSELDYKIKCIKTKSLTNIIKRVDKEFKVRSQIEEALENNLTFVETTEKFKKIVPEKYWDNPTEFYNQLKSSYSFVKAFFHRDKIWKNVLWIAIIILILVLTPVITYLINLLISWQNFTITNGQLFTISIIGSGFVRGFDTFLKLKKQIAPFWKIKEDYEAMKANALFKFDQKEKGLQLEIENFKQEILLIDNQIQLNKEIKATIEFKLKNALSTEALYTFIEKRANSDDYKKHLGIVSLIRKDFEILSGLLTGHKTELVTNKESQEFKAMFEKPLERIILYIDDLDRCPEERVVEVLEAVNLIMAFPLFVVVVGVDPRWVKTALQKKYKNLFNQNSDNDEAISPSNYLEKIFQVPFHLKDADDNSIKILIERLAKTNHNSSTAITKDEIENRTTLDSIDVDIMGLDENEIQKITSTLNIPIIPAGDQIVDEEQIKALDISDEEIEQIKSLTEIIGNNPRAIKRFVNIYRIVKTHEDFDYNEDIEEKEILAIMFLLALPIGKFKDLMGSFESFLGIETIDFETLDHYVSPPPSLGGSKDDKLKSRKTELKMTLQNSNKKTLEIGVTIFRKHNSFIKRFTFNNI